MPAIRERTPPPSWHQVFIDSVGRLPRRNAAITVVTSRNIIISFDIEIQDVVCLKYAGMGALAIQTSVKKSKPSFNSPATLIWS